MPLAAIRSRIINLARQGKPTFAKGRTRPAINILGRTNMTATTSASTQASGSSSGGKSVWAAVPLGPPDAILGITEAFKADQDSRKINLGVGAYRDNAGESFVLESVRGAEARLGERFPDKEYAGIMGVPEFTELAAKLAFGEDSAALKEGRVVVSQSISGTGALRLGADFLSRFYTREDLGRLVYLPTPTWGNHQAIFRDARLEVRNYRYFDKATNGLDLKGMLEDIRGAPKGSIILLHACAHNPTGVDPTMEEWKTIEEAIRAAGHFVFFDMAYQGFASGDPDKDAWAVRHFIQAGHNPVVAQSFAKNMGLYGERAGIVSIFCRDTEERVRVESQLKIVIRPMYSSPPIHGARLVATVLGDAQLRGLWLGEVKKMADRIQAMRLALRQELEALGSKVSWNHITDQIGMFCYTGLKPEQVERMTKEYHVYLTKDGRISIAGINSANVKYLAQAIHEVTKG